MDRWNKSIIPWNSTCRTSAIMTRMTGQSCFQWPNTCTTTQPHQLQGCHPFMLIMGSTLRLNGWRSVKSTTLLHHFILPGSKKSISTAWINWNELVPECPNTITRSDQFPHSSRWVTRYFSITGIYRSNAPPESSAIKWKDLSSSRNWSGCSAHRCAGAWRPRPQPVETPARWRKKSDSPLNALGSP